jgi:predicted AlkP superfamily phosphohydrolase/phosphomutase
MLRLSNLTPAKRVAVIGLDCAEPRLVFETLRDELPTLGRLIREGWSSRMRTTHPPLTIPAWTAMLTGLTPGELGVYGFRNRSDYSYDNDTTASSHSVPAPRVWDIASYAGRRVIVLSVPQTYPPRSLNGELVSCFMTPNREAEFTYPASLKTELTRVAGPYIMDVEDFRSDDKEELLRRIYDLCRQRFEQAKYLASSRPWDFFMMVEMGLDRLHHGFWRYFDPAHPKYEPNHPLARAIPDYYRFLDSQIAELLSLFDNDTAVVICSDHGAQAMQGCICINEWLQREGYLALKETRPPGTVLSREIIDWSNTTAWGYGGYFGRVCLNVKGREPEGIVDPLAFEVVRTELKARLEALGDENGQPINTRVYRPEDLFETVRGIPPDLFVYFGDLRWRSIGSVGWGEVHRFENDTGPDDASHAPHGIFILRHPKGAPAGWAEEMSYLDIAPILLSLIGIPVPDYMKREALPDLSSD